MLLAAQPQAIVRRRDEFQAPVAKAIPSEQTSTPIEVEDIREDSLNRLKESHSGVKQYQIAGNDFESFPEIHKTTATKLKARGIMNLFPIQEHCFYPIYNREDLIARDLTGSGKTLGFALPIVEYLRKNGFLGKRRLQAIVLAPTRELAIQVRLISP